MRNNFFVLVLLVGLGATPLACQSGTFPTSAQLLQAAGTGNAQAQFELARAYEDGKGVTQDDARAVEWFRKSAEQGNAQAQNSLGVMYALGRGVPRDREEAVRWYKKAAKQGFTDGIYNVAISYYNGEGVEEDMAVAYAWMTIAQKRGDPQATEALAHIREGLNDRLEFGQLALAKLYEKGDEIPQDMPAAAALYLEVANLKPDLWVTEVRYKVCLLYMNGTGVPQDYAQAQSWCKKSGTALSYLVLGRMVEKGLGSNKNPKEALDCYRKAAMSNIHEGYMEAGRVHSESGTHDDEKKAYFWYAAAAEQKIPGAEEKTQAAALHLNQKEIADQQKQMKKWLLMPDWMRWSEAKKH